jgi:hypothetical protein
MSHKRERRGMRRTNSADHSGEAEALQRACQHDGCPVCTVVLELVAQAMDTWSYDGFTDIEHREEVTRIRGFCPLHTWQLAQRNTSFQLAIVYENILSTMEEDLGQQLSSLPSKVSEGDWLVEIQRLFQPGTSTLAASTHLYEQCSFCRTRGTIEQRLTERLVTLLHNDNMPSLLRQSTGLCRVHFALAVQYAKQHAPAQHRVLITCQQACVQRVLGEVRELIRKHDYRFSEEARGEEMTSWRRAITLCAGNPGVR